MLLGARTGAWSGKSLPYDAEVEYLGFACNDGSGRYVDSGIYLDSDCEIGGIAYFPTTNAGGYIGFWGDRLGASSKNISIGGNAAVNEGVSDFNNSNYTTYRSSGVITRGVWYEWYSSKAERWCKRCSDGYLIASNNTQCPDVFTCEHTAIIGYSAYFAQNNNRFVYVKNVYANKNGSEIFNAIPVRVGSTGYMYDKANKSGGPNGNGLYPILGIGSIVVGPDV